MRRWAVALACACLSACSLPSNKADTPPLGPGEIGSVHAAKDALALGKSTKGEVRAALGKATVIDFESGYEVWVYKEKPSQKELVLLFQPTGTLAKARVR
jgi:hypothetical protein